MLNENIKRIREERGMTQKQLADKVGISGAFMSLIEKGTNKPSDENLKKIANALDVPVVDLIAEEIQSPEIELIELLIKLTKENKMIWIYFIPGKKAKHIERAKAAPAFNPSNPESARGFPVVPCIIAPETARAAPTKALAITRGIRKLSITRWFISFPLKWNKASHKEAKGIFSAPLVVENIIIKASNPNPPNTISHIFRILSFLFVFMLTFSIGFFI